MLVKVVPQIKNGVALEKVHKKVVEVQYQKTEHKYKKTSSTKVTNDQRSLHNKPPKVDKKKTGVSILKPAVSGGGSAKAIHDATGAPGDPVRKLKVEKAVQSGVDEAVNKLPRVSPVLDAVVTAPYGGSVEAINASTRAQGDLVRRLESEKAAQPEIDETVKKLLPQKSEYKSVTGSDWKPGVVPAPAVVEPAHAEDSGEAIRFIASAQGDLVRRLESDKAAQPEIDEAAKKLLPNKSEYKSVPGTDWMPGVVPAPAAFKPAHAEVSAEAIQFIASAQGDLLRRLESDKAAQSEIDEAVKKLLPQKDKYKSVTGSNCKPRVVPVPAAVEPVHAEESAEAIYASTTAQGEVRKLDSEKATQPEIDQKAEYKSVRGSDCKTGANPVTAAGNPASAEESAEAINAAIYFQVAPMGKLKSEKAAQPQIDEAVNKLILSKVEYKYVTESDWKPGVSPTSAAVKAIPAGGSAESINAAITAQVELVKKLESDEPTMPEIYEAVKELPHLKAEYIAVTGSVWKSGEAHAPAAVEALPDRSINVASSAQSVLGTKQNFEKAQSELDEAVTKLMTQKAGCNAATGIALKPQPARRSSETFNSATADQGDIGRKLKSEKAAQPEVDESAKSLLNLKVEYKVTAGSNWKTAVAPRTSAAEIVPAVGSAEAISVDNTTQGDLVKKLSSEMSDLHDCRSSNSLGNLPDRYLPQCMLADQIPAQELHMQQFVSYQESVYSFQLPVSWVLPHPYYGYIFTPVFLDNTLIFMEDQVSMQQPSEAFKIHDHPQD